MTESGTTATRSRVRRTAQGLLMRAFQPLLGKQQRARRTQFAQLGVPERRVVFLGDSITEFGNWDEWFPDRPVLNRGVAGETSDQVLNRLETAVDEPLAVFLLIGTNDLTAAVPEDRIVANVRAILAGIEQRAPGAPVVVQSVMPRTLPYRGEIGSLNRRYQDLVAAAGPHVRYLDLWPALATPDGRLRPEYTVDDLHLDGAGYRAWVDLLRPVLADLGPHGRS